MGKIFRIVSLATLVFVLSNSPNLVHANFTGPNRQLLRQAESYLKADRFGNVDRVRKITKGADDEETILQLSLLYSKYNNPGNAAIQASLLKSYENMYTAGIAILEMNNPRTFLELVENMPKEYIKRGINDLKARDQYGNARILESRLMEFY